jgi:hypothetical protein
MAQNQNPSFGWKQLKQSPVTSVLGILVILAATASPFVRADMTWSDAAIGACVGSLLLLSPDTLVSKIQSLLGR